MAAAHAQRAERPPANPAQRNVADRLKRSNCYRDCWYKAVNALRHAWRTVNEATSGGGGAAAGEPASALAARPRAHPTPPTLPTRAGVAQL